MGGSGEKKLKAIMKTRTLKILAVSLGLCAAAGDLAAQVTLTMTNFGEFWLTRRFYRFAVTP